MSWASHLGSIAQNLQDIGTKAEHLVRRVTDRLEQRMRYHIQRAKRMLLRTVLEVLLLCTGTVFLLVGFAIFLSRFISLDVALVLVGVILVNVVLLSVKLR